MTGSEDRGRWLRVQEQSLDLVVQLLRGRRSMRGPSMVDEVIQ